jgi:lipopolysaccharide transport system permease protein
MAPTSEPGNKPGNNTAQAGRLYAAANPAAISMRAELAELRTYKNLLQMLVARELKVRYKNSVLGFVWSIVPPLLQVLVFSFLARSGFGATVENYGAYLLCGLIPWTFFSTATQDASMSLLVNYTIIKKIYFPREAIPLANVISNFVHFMLGWAVYFGAFAVLLPLIGHAIGTKLGIPLLPRMLWFPVITFFEVLLVTGLALWVSALNVFYEDVKFILQTVFQLAFFVVPVLFPTDVIFYSSHIMANHRWLFTLYMLNPITAFIDAYRHMLLEPIWPIQFNAKLATPLHPNGPQPLPMQWGTFVGACLISVLVAYSGYWYFNRRKWQFTERP